MRPNVIRCCLLWVLAVTGAVALACRPQEPTPRHSTNLGTDDRPLLPTGVTRFDPEPARFNKKVELPPRPKPGEAPPPRPETPETEEPAADATTNGEDEAADATTNGDDEAAADMATNGAPADVSTTAAEVEDDTGTNGQQP